MITRRKTLQYSLAAAALTGFTARSLAFGRLRTGSNTEWFEQARFGMFIHWGLYSETAGEWRGKRYYGITEWLMRRGKIPRLDYAMTAARFNPTRFDARAWVKVAKSAGVRYIVITSKHHDGFAMFRSKASPYNIFAATPYRRDPLRELCNAARAEGLHIGFYYSQCQDWYEKDAVGNTWDFDPAAKRFTTYLEGKVIPQVTELMKNYGPISVVWFDTPDGMAAEDSKRLYDLVKRLQPKCLVNSRLGNGLGDFTTFGDAEVPAHFEPGRPWEAIFTHNDSWGYSAFDQNYKSRNDLIATMATVASKGGNFLLNIGPKGDGTMPAPSVAVFGELGTWLARNGRSIYGTTGTPMVSTGWGVCTAVGDSLFLHVLTPPTDGRIVVPGFSGTVLHARYLGGKALAYRRDDDDLQVDLLHPYPESGPFVIEVVAPGARIAACDYAYLLSTQYRAFALSPALATLTGKSTRRHVAYYQYFGDWKYFDSIDGATGPDDGVEWRLRFAEPGTYHIALEYSADAASEGNEGTVAIGGQSYRFQVLFTGTIQEERPVSTIRHHLATVIIDRPGVQTLRVRREGVGSNLFALKSVILTPES